MPICTSFAEANLAIAQAYAAMREALPTDAAREALDHIAGCVIQPEKVSEFFELGYAFRDDLTADQRAVVADVGNLAWANGFWGLGADQRGQNMEVVLRGGDLAAGAEPPAPLAKYAPVPGPGQAVAFIPQGGAGLVTVSGE